MSLALICALLLLLGAVLAGIRRVSAVWRMDAGMRPAPWRTAALIVLPLLSAALLYFTLFPPDRQAQAGQLTVLTANAKGHDTTVSGPTIALPEASVASGVATAPDLATALRQRPGLQSVRIIGDGLPVRDREAVSGLSMTFETAAAPTGLVGYWQSPLITPGAPWAVRGRIHAVPKAGIILLDPAGNAVAKSVVDADGRFKLGDEARGPGLSEYTLKILDANGKPIETLTVPIAVSAPIPMHILSLSGGPNAEVKTLRRWAVDSGARLDSRIALGPAMTFQTGQTTLTPANLRESDWLILDERAWDGLSATEKRAVREAINGGLGMLLRVTGPMSATATADFGKLGFRIRDANVVQSVRLPEKTDKPQWPGLSRRPITVQAASAETVLLDSNDQPLAVWRAVGQGRVGMLWLTDSYRLSLAGFPEAHAGLWSALASSLARAKASDSVQLPDGLLRPNQRAVLCQLGKDAQIRAPDGSKTELVIESLPGRGNCAAFWPTASGWHHLESGPRQQPFFVHPTGQGHALDRQSVQQATRQLSAMAKTTTSLNKIAVPGAHWPYFLAWLALTCLLWLLERSRWGSRRTPSESA